MSDYRDVEDEDTTPLTEVERKQFRAYLATLDQDRLYELWIRTGDGWEAAGRPKADHRALDFFLLCCDENRGSVMRSSSSSGRSWRIAANSF